MRNGYKNLDGVLNDYGKYVVQQSKTNLTKFKKGGGDLYNSLAYTVEIENDDFLVSFQMESYGEFVDAGVKGVGGSKADGSQWKLKRVTNNKFKYRNKMPPAKAFNKWIIKKGIAPRNSKGQFTSRKSLQFAIAKSVFHTGIETTNFISDPFYKGLDRLDDMLYSAFIEDIDDLIILGKK